MDADGELKSADTPKSNCGSGAGNRALLIPEILSKVFENLPVKDTAGFRLVNHFWNEEACRVLRRKSNIAFEESRKIEIYNNALRETTDFPHTRFQFFVQNITDGSVRDFWSLFGDHVRHVGFNLATLYRRDLLEVLQNHVPNISSLLLQTLPKTILKTGIPDGEQEGEFPFPRIVELHLATLPRSIPVATERLSDLLKYLPSLNIITFPPIFGCVEKSLVSDVIGGTLVRPEVNLNRLKRVDATLELVSADLEGLAQKSFSFESLSISLAAGVNCKSFRGFVCSVSSSLIALDIQFPDFCPTGLEECIPSLTHLKTLKMKNFRGSVNFIARMPNLRQLKISTPTAATCVPFGLTLQCGGSSSRVTDHGLKSLKIISASLSNPITDTMSLESVTMCFPTLTLIHLHGVDDDGLGIIYRQLPFLTDIELTKSTLTDKGLTGIQTEICKDLYETRNYTGVDNIRSDLFIGSLPHLRDVIIHSGGITDVSIFAGLVYCKKLRSIKLRSPLVTDSGVIHLSEVFQNQLLTLDVSECSQITQLSTFYAGEKLKGTGREKQLVRLPVSALTSKANVREMMYFPGQFEVEDHQPRLPDPLFPRWGIHRLGHLSRESVHFMELLQRFRQNPDFERLFVWNIVAAPELNVMREVINDDGLETKIAESVRRFFCQTGLRDVTGDERGIDILLFVLRTEMTNLGLAQEDFDHFVRAHPPPQRIDGQIIRQIISDVVVAARKLV